MRHEKKSGFILLSPLFYGLDGLDRAYPLWGGKSTLQSLPIHLLISLDTPSNNV